MDEITATLYLDNYDDLPSFSDIVKDIFTEKPERILVKGEKRILNNGMEQAFPNKTNQVTFRLINNPISIKDISEAIYYYFESHAEKFITFKHKIKVKGHVFIHIKADHRYLGEVHFDLKTIQILSKLEIEIVIGFLLSEEDSIATT